MDPRLCGTTTTTTTLALVLALLVPHLTLLSRHRLGPSRADGECAADGVLSSRDPDVNKIEHLPSGEAIVVD